MNTQTTPTIDQIETEVVKLSRSEQQSWQRVAELLILTEEKSLWTIHAKSFTQWVKGLAAKAKVQESNFWRALKAGRTYEQIRRAREAEQQQAAVLEASDNVSDITPLINRSEATACDLEALPSTDKAPTAALPPLAEATVAPESLELIEKISRVAPDTVIAEVTEKALSGRMGRAELREIWTTYRNATEGSSRGRGGCGQSSVDDSKLTAASIVDLIRKDDAGRMIYTLLFEEHRQQATVAEGRAKRGQEYACLPEFAVYTGTTRSARRMDALLVANDIQSLVGIEIKVSRYDLENDQKFMEYQPYCNALYLAVPAGLDEIALNLAPESVGVMAINPNSQIITIPRTAETQCIQPVHLIETLHRLALKWYRR